MFRYFAVLFFLILITDTNAGNKEKIINTLKNTNNLNFDFEQNINGKIENGNCVIEYPKKIFCEYSGNKKKIIVSNGKSLVIKTVSSYYRYPLKKTPLNFILDKNFLINKINNSQKRIVENKFVNYSFIENDNEINIFFDKKNNLIGWQIIDIYQNLNITFLSSIIKNQILDNNMFVLPRQN